MTPDWYRDNLYASEDEQINHETLIVLAEIRDAIKELTDTLHSAVQQCIGVR